VGLVLLPGRANRLNRRDGCLPRAGGKDRPFWLEAKEGHSWSIDRKTSGSVHAEICAVSILGGIQNEKLKELVYKEGLTNDGFLQRFIPAYLKRTGRGEDIPPNESLDAIMADIGPRIGKAPPQLFKFTPEADEELKIVERFAETESERPDVSDHMREWLGKLPGEFGRMALAFHIIEWAVCWPMFGDEQPDAMISKFSATLARRYLTEFVFGHARVLYNSLGGKGEYGQARIVAGLIMARGLTTITDRDLQRATKQFRGPTKENVRQEVMAELDFCNWVRPTGAVLNGRCREWAVNPAVHDGRFAEIAGAERARREDLRGRFR
jgi:Protein of unknown function (DUF3987)